jgi:hypothetical protein
MTASARFKQAAVATVAALGVLATSGAASAQSYGGYYNQGYGQTYGQGQSYYDPCVREQRERQTTGGLLGAAIGAVAGSQVASRGRRTEGSLLGGVLGAAVGAAAGRGQAACVGGQYRQPYAQSSQGYDYYGQNNGYGQHYGYNQSYGYDQGYYDPRQDAGYGRHDDYGYSRPVHDSGYQNADQCRLAESTIRLPDGRVDTRYVRTCPDQNGRYRVVD